jgi:uncharacterized protein (TIGR03437 family)
MQFAYGSNGLYRIGAGTYPYLGLNVAVQAPVLSGSGVYINPDGIVNSASSAPFTAGVSDGELITIYGSNLAAGTVVSPVVPLPTTLGGVQVLINSTPAALYYVSPGQIAAIVPFANPFSVAQIQVVNTMGTSNTVTELVNTTTPGVFTNPPGGVGYAAAVHATGTYAGQLVSPSAPAAPGETIETFLTGLGTVYPAISPDGAPGPTSTLAQTVQTITAYIGGDAGTVTYAGLAPTLAALYQVNVTIPTTATTGDNVYEVDGPDGFAAQALISVGGTLSGSDRQAHDESSASVEKPARIPGPKHTTKDGHPITMQPAAVLKRAAH